MNPSNPACFLPCVVQVGFAGSRQLFDPPPEGAEANRLHAAVVAHLRRRLESLTGTLGLDKHRHFLCGISQIAVGADTAFTRTCRELDIPQRIFLPQHEDAYLSAIDSRGAADFSEGERAIAESLLASAHIIERRVTSEGSDRQLRFEETNCEITAESDLVICLLRAGAEPKPGGSAQFLQLAKHRGTPALEIQVSVRQGKLHFDERWHRLDRFKVPALPEPLPELEMQPPCPTKGLPTINQFADVVKHHFSAVAARQRKRFENAALMIIGTHIGATLCATVVLAGAGSHGALERSPVEMAWPLVLLAIELVALASGYLTHKWLHKARPSRQWAVARLTAEIHRSVQCLGKAHMPLDYLFRLRLPSELLPLSFSVRSTSCT